MQNWHHIPENQTPEPEILLMSMYTEVSRPIGDSQLCSCEAAAQAGLRFDSLQTRGEDGVGIITHGENVKGVSETEEFRYENRPSELVDQESKKK